MKWKFLLLFPIVSLIQTTSFAQREARNILAAIKNYKESVYNNAIFHKSKSEVWNAMYTIATEEYSTIERESRDRGFIDAKQEDDTYKEYFTIQMSEDTPYRIILQARADERTKNNDGTYTSWHSQNHDFTAYYKRLRMRLYGLLVGPIEIPKELQDQVDAYNLKQSKARRKIVKGVDY